MPISLNLTCPSVKSLINDSNRWSGSDLMSVMSSAPSSLNECSGRYLVKKWSGKVVDSIGPGVGVAASSINEYFAKKGMYWISGGEAGRIHCGEHHSYSVFWSFSLAVLPSRSSARRRLLEQQGWNDLCRILWLHILALNENEMLRDLHIFDRTIARSRMNPETSL